MNDGDPLPAKPLKDLVASLQVFLNGAIGNANILVPLDPSDKIAYAKLALTGMIQSGDIAGVNLSAFSTLKVKAQASPNNTVVVQPGTYLSLNGLLTRLYAGGNSAAFGNTSGAGQNRIDVLTINDAGALGITVGVEGGAPVAPDYPADTIPLAEIYIRFSAIGVVIKDLDDSVNSYIKTDTRSLLTFTGVSDGAITYGKLAFGNIFRERKLLVGTDIGDPGTSFVTMTNMEYTITTPQSFEGHLIYFEAPITLRQASSTDAFPAAEIRLMVSVDGGAYQEVIRTLLDCRTDNLASSSPAEKTIPVTLVGSWANAVSPASTAFKIEWRRLNGSPSGTPSIRQDGSSRAQRQLLIIGINKPTLLV